MDPESICRCDAAFVEMPSSTVTCEVCDADVALADAHYCPTHGWWFCRDHDCPDLSERL